MARAGSISMRRLIFIVSSMFLVERSVAAARCLVERSPRWRTMLHCESALSMRNGDTADRLNRNAMLGTGVLAAADLPR